MGLDHGLLRGDWTDNASLALGDDEVDVAEWRKANAVHRWFVANVQDGRDDCRRYPVTAERLRELLSRLQAVLAGVTTEQPGYGALGKPEAVETAKRLLPTAEGFFFGVTNYGETYVRQLEYTRDALATALAEVPDDQVFTYWSSW